MKTKLLVCVLLAAIVTIGTADVVFTFRLMNRWSAAAVTATPPAPVMSGSVIFWEDSALVGPIFRRTGSHITHAAIVLDSYVYEAVPPCVHKVSLAQYIERMKIKSRRQPKFKWFIMQPRAGCVVWQLAAMKRYAEAQLGRPYSVRGWWRGYEVRGIFCSAYVANILEQAEIIKSAGVHESPVSLYEKLEPIYD